MDGRSKSIFSLLPKEIDFLNHEGKMSRVFDGKFNGYRFELTDEEKQFLGNFVKAVLDDEMTQKEYSLYRNTMIRVSRSFLNKNSDIIIDAMHLNTKEKAELIRKANISNVIIRSVDKDGVTHINMEEKKVSVLDALFCIPKRMHALCQRILSEDPSLSCEEDLDINFNRFDYFKNAIKDEEYDNLYVSCIVEKLEEEFDPFITNDVAKRMLERTIEEVPSLLIRKIDVLNGNINQRNEKHKDEIYLTGVSKSRMREELESLSCKRRTYK